jgi:succinate dehydrogenase hydrophobic anchor subunit
MFTSIDIIAPIIVGAAIGVIFSLLFTKYTTLSYNASIFGINSNVLLRGILLFVIIAGIVGLAGMSAIITDIEYPALNPVKFLLESLLITLLPSLAILFIIYCRKNKITARDNLEVGILGLKFLTLHILLQFSGYYRYIFG